MYRPAYNNSSVRGALFSQKNRDTLKGLLVQDFEKRTGGQLTGKEVDRLDRTLEHYIDEVYEKQGEQSLPVLNKEVLRISAQDFSTYIQRQTAVRSAPTAPVQTVMNEQLFHDTAKRFELMQQDRQEIKALPPPVPDFRVSLEDDSQLSSVELYERAKKAREMDALRSQANAMDRMDPGIQKRIAADDMFRSSQSGMNQVTDLALMERRGAPKAMMDMPLVVPPDRRELMLPTSVSVDGSPMPRGLGQANSNTTIVQPQLESVQKANLPQDYLIRQENTVSYKEVENNLFIYSADRDWLINTRENRYSFTVNFDPANNRPGFAPSPFTQQKFKNITRIELVKAIMPAEAIDILITRDMSGTSSVPVTTYQNNILSFPYINVTVQELDGNNYGTDNFLDRSFGVLQYDANWYSDPASLTVPQDSRGFLAMIPKFLKCQKEYSPTPLSTLQKMTISMSRPDGSPISLVPDTLDISGILGGNAALFAPSIYYTSVGTVPDYFFINTTSFFSRFQVSIGDRILIAGFNYDDATLAANPDLRDFVTWINKPEGHLVVAIGNTTGAYQDTANAIGYANYIVIQARYDDPASGSVALKQFNADINTILTAGETGLLKPRRLMNVNRQIQLVFRVITREMDSVAQLRPDNM
jgi:hypothetical protein